MILRTFRFRAKKRTERRLLPFMRREGLRLLRRSPGCRAAYFCRQASSSSGAARRRKGWKRPGEYIWVTLWMNERALKAAQKRQDWQRVVRIEEGEYFAGRPQAGHYGVLLRK